MGPHLGYGDVICDRACSVSFRRELESMRCSAALAVAGAAGGGGRGRGGFMVGCGGLWDIWDWLWFSCGVAHSGKSLISVFQDFFASINKNFILTVGLGAALSFYGVWAAFFIFS